jgi:VWFA-related protein
MNMAWVEMKGAHHTRKAIILISDGEDNVSRMTRTEFKQLATESDTTVYSLFIGGSPDYSTVHYGHDVTGAALLDEIAKQTGGRMFVVSDLKRLPKITARIGSWVRSQYVLGYVPRDESRNGEYHRIQVKISKPAGLPRLRTFWRLGYYAPKP